MTAQVNAFIEKCISDANSIWADLRLKYPRPSPKDPAALVIRTESASYSFTETDPPLVVLGDGTMEMTCVGYVQTDGTYELTFTFKIDDPFDGVLSGGIGWLLETYLGIKGIGDRIEKLIGEVDVPGFDWYPMTATWYETRRGKLQ